MPALDGSARFLDALLSLQQRKEKAMSSQTIEQRLADLEAQVTEIGHVLHELIEELRDKGHITDLPIPPCPPICPRA
jgi:hypothetical protein